jgi:hypothetical protein
MSATCRSCGAPIIWAEMANRGRRRPLDAEQVATGLRFRFGVGVLPRQLVPGR